MTRLSNLRMLDEYRRSFGEAHEAVVKSLRERLQLEPTGRPAKSTTSLHHDYKYCERN